MVPIATMMTVPLLALTLLPWSAGATAGQTSRESVQVGGEIDSEILGRAVRYSVYLPAGYGPTGRSLPVLYMLHGAGGDATSWINEGDVHRTADRLISTGALPPMILVMPDGGTTRYLNNYDGSVRYEDFFFTEFIPHIESTYRTGAAGLSRAVLGSSMGGYGSLMYALRHPDMFATAVSLSGSFCEDERVLAMSVEEWNTSTRGPAYGPDLVGSARFTDHYRAWDPCHVIGNSPPGAFESVRLYLDCGDDDFRNDGNAALHVLMRRHGIPHEYRVRNGGHGWPYYRSGLPEALEFVGAGFRDVQ